MNGRINSGTGATYHERMLRVLVYIQQHLDEAVGLEELVGVAHFSPFHCHRVFRGMVGESVQAHIRRLRLERATYRLKFTNRPGRANFFGEEPDDPVAFGDTVASGRETRSVAPRGRRETYRDRQSEARARATGAGLPIAEFRLPNSDCRVPIAEFRLPNSDCRLPIVEQPDALPPSQGGTQGGCHRAGNGS